MRMARLVSLAAGLFTLAIASPSFAQVGGGFGWSSGGAPTGGTYGMPAPPPTQTAPSNKSTDLEIGTLYVAAASYGVGTGIWLDAELGISDPGLRFIAPGVLGVGAPVGVYFADHPAMPRGVPAAISVGLAIGGGEGFGIWSYQFVKNESDSAWGFKELARSTFIGSTIGGVAGAAVGYTMGPSPKTSMLLGSGVIWGAGIGTMFGYGASESGIGYGRSNDSASLGGLIGYNIGLAGAAGLSTVWIPSYKNLAYMWAGAGAGFVVTLPVYLFYAGSDGDEHPAKRGLIVQGVGVTAGIAAGAAFTFYDKDDLTLANKDPFSGPKPAFAQVTAVGPMAVPGGMGAQLSGILF